MDNKNIDDYKWWAGPKGRQVAARIKGYKRNTLCLLFVVSFEAAVIAGLVTLFFKSLNGGH